MAASGFLFLEDDLSKTDLATASKRRASARSLAASSAERMTETLESDAVASSSEERGLPSALFPDDQEAEWPREQGEELEQQIGPDACQQELLLQKRRHLSGIGATLHGNRLE